jgi:serine phosphatase RsbU (regulator of sigma subunit)
MPHTRTPLQGLVRMAWTMPLLGLPFALLFGTMSGGTFAHYRYAYAMALVYGYAIGLCNWTLGALVLPRIRGPKPRNQQGAMVREGVWYTATSLFGAAVASLIIHFTILPGYLGDGREIALIAMFTLLFTAMFLGFSYARVFYRQALQQARAEQELNMARRIQRSFLLSHFPKSPRIEVHALNVSSREVSGDFYDVVPSGSDKMLLAVADVSGKGVPAALLSSMLQAALRAQSHAGMTVAQQLANINVLVCDRTAPEQFATFFLARVDEASMTMTYANGGHNPPILFHRDGTHELLEKGGTVLGFLPDATFDEATVPLRPGDLAIVYTDGVTEAVGAADEMFGEERLEALVRGLDPSRGAREIVEDILAGLRRHLGGREAGDDVTVLVMRVLDGGSGTG